MNIGGIVYESLADGLGVRLVIFISGCKWNCKGCHNQRMFDFNYGKPFTKKEQVSIIKTIKDDPLLQGVTISGGDPMFSWEDVMSFLQLFKQELPTHDVWLYTGFQFEDIKDLPIMQYIDVLVDGKFEIDKKNISIAFRGSSNQRIIDVQKSLQTDLIVLHETN